jgi:hypothetical protein
MANCMSKLVRTRRRFLAVAKRKAEGIEVSSVSDLSIRQILAVDLVECFESVSNGTRLNRTAPGAFQFACGGFP